MPILNILLRHENQTFRRMSFDIETNENPLVITIEGQRHSVRPDDEMSVNVDVHLDFLQQQPRPLRWPAPAIPRSQLDERQRSAFNSIVDHMLNRRSAPAAPAPVEEEAEEVVF